MSGFELVRQVRADNAEAARDEFEDQVKRATDIDWRTRAPGPLADREQVPSAVWRRLRGGE